MKKTVGITVAIALAASGFGWYMSATYGGQSADAAAKVFAQCCVLIVIYFIPAAIAADKEMRNAGAVYALNLFLGWTVIGWVIALVWSLTKDQPAPIVQVQAVQAAGRFCTSCGAQCTGPFCQQCGKPVQVPV